MHCKGNNSKFAMNLICWFHGSFFKDFYIVFLLPDWLMLNHLTSRVECGFSDIFSRHICSTAAETITTQQVLARKNVQKTTFEAAEMMLGSRNQQHSHIISGDPTVIKNAKLREFAGMDRCT